MQETNKTLKKKVIEKLPAPVADHVSSRTMLFGYALLILGYAEANIELVSNLLGEYKGVALFVIGLTTMILRTLTTSPLKGRSDAGKI